MSFASIGVLTACLVITGIAALMSLNVGKFVDYLGAQNKVIVYLKLDADDATIESAKQAIGGVPNILSSTYVSKEDALNETKADSQTMTAVPMPMCWTDTRATTTRCMPAFA